MQKGGYQIIDLENWKFTTTKGAPVAKTQKGVYALVQGTRKVIGKRLLKSYWTKFDNLIFLIFI